VCLGKKLVETLSQQNKLGMVEHFIYSRGLGPKLALDKNTRPYYKNN
jgi:hypothetical protein